MSKKTRRMIVLSMICAGMVFLMGCGAGKNKSAGRDTGKEVASTVENGENAAKDNVANNKEDFRLR